MLVVLSCDTSADQADKRIISVSILPQKYFVEALAGDEFEVNVLIPPGSSPASYDPSPKQMRDLSKSDLYLKMGHLGFEKAWMDNIQRNHQDLKIVDLSAGVEPIETNLRHGDHFHEGVDPHIWMSPKTAMIMVENMARAIIRYDPACKDMVNKNLEDLKSEISGLDKEFILMSEKLEMKKFIIFHPALTYLARDYGLEQIAMEFEGKEPSAAYMKGLVDRAKSENIKTVFIQKEFDQDRAKQLSKELDARLIQIDPLAEDWVGMMEELVGTFE